MKKRNTTETKSFWNDPSESHAREELFMHFLLADLKFAATQSDYHLLTYTTPVDHDGFDIIFDNRDHLIKIQVKTKRKSAGTRSWEIHKRLLRNQKFLCEVYSEEYSPETEGLSGGVILMEFDETQEEYPEIEYWYSDIF